MASTAATLIVYPLSLLALNSIDFSEESEASILYKLIPYIEWPLGAFAHAQAPIVVGVVDADGMFDALARVASGRPARGRPVEVRQLSKQTQEHGVHLMYVGTAAWNERMNWLGAHEPTPVLVTNAPGAIDQGATVGFVADGKRVRIEASLAAAHKAGVKLSSRLLVVAQRVVEAQK